MSPRPRTLLGAGLATALALAASAAPALATHPGRNGAIAFVRDGDIWAVNPDGTGLVQLTTDPGAEESPAWSADGRELLFTRLRDDNADVWRLNVADGTAVQLTRTAPDELTPSPSPDGRLLAWARLADGQMYWSAYLADRDGTGERVLAEAGYDPDWSPDGSRLVLATGTDTSDVDVVAADGSDLHAFPGANDAAPDIETWPSWSPDGRAIVYSRIDYDAPTTGDAVNQLAVVDLFGNRRVLRSADVGPLHFHGSWSPDGTAIAYSERDGGLWVMPAAGGEPTRVTAAGTGVSDPAWQPLPPASPAPTTTTAPPPSTQDTTPVPPLTVTFHTSRRVRAGRPLVIRLHASRAVAGQAVLVQVGNGRAFATRTRVRMDGRDALARVRLTVPGPRYVRLAYASGGARRTTRAVRVLVVPARRR